MGVPYFYAQIIKKYPNINKDKISKCDRLFLDFNALIHGVSALVINKNPINYKNEDIFKEIINYVLNIINICNPTNLLYIAVDGVAPLAKIAQQRKRRYLSSFRNTIINDFKKKNNLPISNWDSNIISPGTSFMIELNTYLKNYFNENKFAFEVIISGHDIRNEAEHKFIRYIKEHNIPEYLDVILGLDCDLLFLSLSCNKTNIFLMREDEKQIGFKYVSIDKLKESIIDYTNISSIYDYIVISILFGNDFLPSLSFLKLKNNALDIIVNIYKKVYNSLNENLVLYENDLYTLNHIFFVKMLELLYQIEDSNMIEIIDIHNNMNYNYKRRFETKLEQFIYEHENNPIINKYHYQINPSTDSNWRSSYYQYLFGSHSNDIKKDSSIKYIEGILWVINYYFNLRCDNLWNYGFDYSPCIDDLYKYAYSIEVSKFKKMQLDLLQTNPDCEEIDNITQLLLILPPQSIDIIPEKYRKIYTDINYGCVHLFPVKFDLSTFLKTQTWECIPMLPIINVKKIQNAIKKI